MVKGKFRLIFDENNDFPYRILFYTTMKNLACSGIRRRCKAWSRFNLLEENWIRVLEEGEMKEVSLITLLKMWRSTGAW